MSPRPRLAVRGLILRENRLLMVNAWPKDKSDLICAPDANPIGSEQAEFGLRLHRGAQHIAGGYFGDPQVLTDKIALCAFACTRPA